MTRITHSYSKTQITQKNQILNTNSIVTKTELALRARTQVQTFEYDENGDRVLDTASSNESDIQTLLTSPSDKGNSSSIKRLSQRRLSKRVRRASASSALRRHSQTESHSKSDQELMKIAPPASPVVARDVSVSRESLESHDFQDFHTPDAIAFSATVDALVDDDGDGFVSPPPTPTGSDDDDDDDDGS